MTLPERLLTELWGIWLFTLEFLATKTAMTPVPRSSSRSLRHFAYNNCVPSFAMRPVLLAGHRVQSLLAATIRPPPGLPHIGCIDWHADLVVDHHV